jgi:hypothetical protein
MNHSEYLRRKMAAAPKVLGAARPGDASETTRIRGAMAAAAGRLRIPPNRTQPPAAICCGPRVQNTSLPSGQPVYISTPIRLGPGCGLTEDRSNTIRASVAAGCALLGTAAQGWPSTPVTRMAGCIPTGEITKACCAQEWTPEVPRDAEGNPTDPTLKALAYQGEVGCCHIDGPPLYMLDPATLNHCCRPAGNIDTVTMTNVPAFELPIAPAPGPRCCPAPAPAVVGCDSNGYPL